MVGINEGELVNAITGIVVVGINGFNKGALLISGVLLGVIVADGFLDAILTLHIVKPDCVFVIPPEQG